jgi:hypothetical protein
VLLTPHGIRSLRPFVELLVLIAEDEPDVGMWKLLLEE